MRQFGLWQGRNRIGCETVNEPGALVRNDLITANPGPARAFYAAVFDFSLDGIRTPEQPVLAAVRLMPATAIRGAFIPMRRRWRCPVRIVSSTRSGFARSITVRSETWVET